MKRLILLILSSAALGQSSVFAVPITLQFDARVSDVYTSNHFALPFSVTVGDVLHGSFTFEPGPPAQAYVQHLGLNIAFPVADLNSSTYQMSVFRNEIAGTPEIPGTQSFDGISIGCSLSAAGPQCSPSENSSIPGLKWTPLIEFGGNSPILNNYDVPADLAVWNQFPYRGLSISFTQSIPYAIGLVRVDASINALSLVPDTSGPTGDLDANGSIDAADYVVWRHKNGTENDYKLWRGHFGQSIAGSGTSFAGTIPEPSTIVLSGIALASFRVRRNRICRS